MQSYPPYAGLSRNFHSADNGLRPHPPYDPAPASGWSRLIRALRFAAFSGTTSGFWLGLQADYDTEEAAQELSGMLAQIHRFEPLAA